MEIRNCELKYVYELVDSRGILEKDRAKLLVDLMMKRYSTVCVCPLVQVLIVAIGFLVSPHPF